MIGVYLYDIFGASAGNKSSHPKDESNSITNQRNLIMEYIKSDAVLSTYTVREYIDDGISGTRFDREAFEEMMTQVKEGNIQVIITKKSKNRIIRINTGILSNMKQKIKEFYH